MATPTRKHRTQAERSERTRELLLDATVECLVELGYAHTTVQEICQRAGVSHGGLFRHFSSRIELLIHVAEDVGEGLLELYRRDFERLRKSTPDELVLALKLLRVNTQSRLHQAWFELQLAARTDHQLHEALLPIWKRRYEATQQLALALLPDAAREIPDFTVIVDTMVTLFHGEAMDGFLREDRQSEQRRMDWLVKLMELVLKQKN